jgi:predicted tellurium resistance membrane protein TerC
MHLLTDPQAWASLATLTALEVVLGIDNLVFIAILTGRLPPAQRARARRLGLALALLTRLALLGAIAFLAGLTAPVFSIAGHGISWRDIVLLAGGVFLLVKAGHEIGAAASGAHGEGTGRAAARLGVVIAQIALFDIIFSLDSVITAVGLAQHLPVMVAAVVIAMAVMALASGPLARFVEAHASVRMLALATLALIGAMLVAEGAGLHIPRATVFAAMGFAAAVEGLNRIAHWRHTRGSRHAAAAPGTR